MVLFPQTTSSPTDCGLKERDGTELAWGLIRVFCNNTNMVNCVSVGTELLCDSLRKWRLK